MDVFENHVDICKRHRMDIMDEYLASLGQKRKPISKDGSSLFRAVSEQLFSTQQHHISVREACIAHMRNNSADFEDFVDDPFDEYLDQMHNPKESGDQIEISALSQLYKCDFYIYEQPGQTAKNVTENLFDKVIHLCHSGQKHYDCVYPIQYFSVYGICQSIINSILFTKVLDMKEDDDENRVVNTYRMLCSGSSDCQKDKKNKYQCPELSFSMVYEPSIGTFDKSVSIEKQLGLAFKLPVSLGFARSLDPYVCRNIDYDFWITIKRRQQFIDSSVAEGLLYCIGDRCLVYLNIYSKPLIGHVQEVSPDFGPITVFIEDLGEMHSLAIKDVKPLDSYLCGRSEKLLGRSRRYFNDDSWNQRRSRHQKSPGKNGSKSERTTTGNSRASTDQANGGCSQHVEASAQQQRKYSGSRKNHKSPSRRNKQNKNFSSSDSYYSSKSLSKWRNKPQNIDQSPCAGNSPPSRLLHQLSLSRDGATERTAFSENADNNQAPYSMPHYPPNADWEEEESSAFPLGCDPEYPRDPLASRSNGVEATYWNDELCSSYSCEQISKDGNDEDGHQVAERSTAYSTYESRCVQVLSQNGTPPTAPDSSVPESVVVLHQDPIQEPPAPLLQYGGPDAYVPYFSAMGPSYPCAPQPSPSPQSGFGVPYSGSITVLDCEGKEMVVVDEKSPFQYFYNLGVEYYRQLSMGGARGTFGYGPSVPPPNAYGSPPPVMHPHPVGYLSPPVNPPLVAPVVQHPPCVPHYHSFVPPPPGGVVQFPTAPPPGRMLVHIPPALPPSSLPTSFSSTVDGPVTNSAVVHASSPPREESRGCLPDQSAATSRSLSSAPSGCFTTPIVQSNAGSGPFPASNFPHALGVHGEIPHL